MHTHDRYERMDEILTPRLSLRPMRREDAADVVAWRSHPATAVLFFGAPPTLEEHLRWFEGPRFSRVDYVVVERATGRRIGTLNYKDIDENRRTAETGTLIGHRPSRGRGLALEAKVAWMLYGFACLGLASVHVQIRSDNKRMIALDAGIGYVREGERRLKTASGEWHAFVRMRLDAETCAHYEAYDRFDLHGFLRRIPSGAGDLA